jgi:lycopene beta-cyclase
MLTSGRVLATSVVIDATGVRRVLSGGPPRGPRIEQTAYGVVLPGDMDEAVFMDWRPAPGFDTSTFLYAVPLPGKRVLFEETSLARRPGLGMAELRARLLARGIPAGERVERVRIPLDLPLPRLRAGVIPFGAAAALVHPATGYSIADTFRLAPRLAETIAADPAGAARILRILWPPAARLVHLLRRRGLAVLQGLPPHRVPEFFELFFGLPVELQRRYLGDREDFRGTARVMAALFRGADRNLRGTITKHAFLPAGMYQ